MTGPAFSVVIPTVGRPSLRALLDALRAGGGPQPVAVVVVDDRREPWTPLDLPDWTPLQVVPGSARGPAAARNVGWRATATPWVAFLDDDVLPPPTWTADLVADLAGLAPSVAGSQGRLEVPLPAGRRPTDWERVTAGLAGAAWATADMAFRRSALVRVGGFDERFPRAYREDADLALRLLDAGCTLVRGRRVVQHPVRPASRWISVRTQAGNADDALLRRLHGRDWRARAGAGRGRLSRHVLVTAAAVASLTGIVTRNRTLALGAGLGWLAGTLEFAAARIAPGPRTPAEVATMALTSAVIPPVAVAHRVRGTLAARQAGPWATPGFAILFDRDGTLVHDVPYNGDPALVEPVPGALAAVTRLRAGGVPLGVVTNQSGIGRGTVTREQVDRVNARVDELLGPFDTWQLCPHTPDAGCDCRKPRPGLVLAAASALGVPPSRCVVIGDIGADVAAARAAGARGVLVPTAVTKPEEVRAAPVVAPDLATAVDLALAMAGSP
ncbi:MAG TPA: HAD-IIIA family hydrolase [Mycobacteriales bacterium]|nr:HAD-IIIA family hydrolase [Mycobacteriales bacterium]